MIIFDLIFLKIFNFALRIKENKSDSKWSSFLLVSTYFACTIISVISFIGLFSENYVCGLFKRFPLEVWMSIFVLSPIILSLRYYKRTGILHIEETYISIDEKYKKIINSFTYTLMILIPVLTFSLFRLFVIGQLKWW